MSKVDLKMENKNSRRKFIKKFGLFKNLLY